MYKVTWSKGFRAFGVNAWAYKDNTPQTHTKEYERLNDIYRDVEVAWSKGYVPRHIESEGYYLKFEAIRNDPRYIGSVFIGLKYVIDDIKEAGGLVALAKKNEARYARYREVSRNAKSIFSKTST